MTLHLLKILLMAAIAGQIGACVTHNSLKDSERPKAWAKSVNQKENLYQITPLLYRSKQPEMDDMSMLQNLGIDVIVNLRPQNDSGQLFGNTNVHVVQVPIHTWAINKHDVLSAMKAIEQANLADKKVLLHCYHGSDRTGVMAAMYRILYQDWSPEQAVYEMKYGGYGFHPIWLNFEKLFDDSTINWLKSELSK